MSQLPETSGLDFKLLDINNYRKICCTAALLIIKHTGNSVYLQIERLKLKPGVQLPVLHLGNSLVFRMVKSSEPFQVTNGVKQDCMMAQTLFIIMFSVISGS